MNLQQLSENVTALIKVGKLPKEFEITVAKLTDSNLEIAYGHVGDKFYKWDSNGKAFVSHGKQLGIIEDEDGSATAAMVYTFQRLPQMDFNSL